MDKPDPKPATSAWQPVQGTADATDSMARAYLQAYKVYWFGVDEGRRKPGVRRNGTPHEATLVGLRAALAVAPSSPAAFAALLDVMTETAAAVSDVSTMVIDPDRIRRAVINARAVLGAFPTAPASAEPKLTPFDAVARAMDKALLLAGAVAMNDTHKADEYAQRLRSHLVEHMYPPAQPTPAQLDALQRLSDAGQEIEAGPVATGATMELKKVIVSKADAAALQAHKERWAFKLSEMRHYLNEAHQFAAMSPRGKENIATALEILSELEAGA